MQDSIKVGDEIVTAGGMHGTVRELGEEELRLEIAPGVLVTLDRRAVAAVARDLEEDDVEDGDVEDGEDGEDLGEADLEGGEEQAAEPPAAEDRPQAS